MPLNPEAVGLRGEPSERSWDSKDSLLYAVGVGCGPDDLAFATENSMDVEQRVLPTQAVVLGTLGGGVFDKVGTFNPAMLVHGEQGVTLHREIPVAGTLRATTTIAAMHDKGEGKAGIIVLETESVLADSGEPLFTTTMSAVIRGEGGFGGERGPSVDKSGPPERDPDHSVTLQTREDQALIYRLSGDRNPLHSDPKFAELAGFPRPILHGLCTFGFTGRALLSELCGNDPARFKAINGRFSSPVFPGEALTVNMWTDGGTAVFQTLGDDGRVVLDGGTCEFDA